MTGLSKRKWRSRTLHNVLGEVAASFVYSLIFYVFVARFLSDHFHISYDQLSLILAGGFLGATYLGSHRFSVDVLPFITLIKLLEEGFSLKRLLHLPAQIIGTIAAYVVFELINAWLFSNIPESLSFSSFQLPLFNPNLVLLFNGAGVAVFYFVYSIIRYRFRLKRFVGLLFTTFLLGTLIFVSIRVEGLTFTNPLGFLVLTLFGDDNLSFTPLTLLTQVGSPALFVVIVYIYSRVTRQGGESKAREQLSNFDL